MTSNSLSSTQLQGSCTICFEDLKQQDKISAIVCGHIFHNGCISQWIAKKKQCPSCRRSIPRNGFVEKLFFDVQRLGGDADTTPEVNYREEHLKLATTLSTERGKLEMLGTENKALKNTIKSLEKKVTQEKEKYRREVPKLQATINHLTISSEETNYLKRELQDAKNKVKSCEFYKILTTHSDEADKLLGEYLRENGDLETEKYLQLLKARNKELSDKRYHAAKKIEQMRSEIQKLKQTAQADAMVMQTLKQTVLDLRERANINTPINNKRLRAVLETETPQPARKKSMGFDESIQMINDINLSFLTSQKDENKIPHTVSIPTISKNDAFDIDENVDDEYFRTPKLLERKNKMVLEKPPSSLKEDSFDFDIPVPQNIVVRTLPKVSENLQTKNKIKQEPVTSTTTQKPARISSFFIKTASSSSANSVNMEYVTLD